MKILYAIQGTGNGHVSRAREIIPILQEFGDLEVLLSGTQSQVSLPVEPTYRFKGMSLIMGNNGNVDLVATMAQLSTRTMIKNMADLPVTEYNLVITDFEPVSAWACQQKKVPCIGLGHQYAVLGKGAPRARKKDFIGKMILRYYAPCTYRYGFHFQRYNKQTFTPVIRSEVRNLKPEKGNHYTVYLPAFDEVHLAEFLLGFDHVNWQVFSQHLKTKRIQGNIEWHPIHHHAFIQSMANARGVLCGAGFETPAEALFLKKNLAVIPMKGQYEQQCNAEALQQMGVTVLKGLKSKHAALLEEWLLQDKRVKVLYPDNTREVLEHLVSRHACPNGR